VRLNHGPCPRGTTLVEMLVTLVIVSLVAAIVGQALAQLARIERMLESGSIASLSSAVRAEWVRGALASVVPGEIAGGDVFDGQERELIATSADFPRVPEPGLARMRLRMHYDETTSTTELQLDDPTIPSEETASPGTVVMSWPGRAGRFQYLDAAGEWKSSWSVKPGGTLPALPLAIAVETGLLELPLVVAVVRSSQTPLPTRRRLESM
jgi:prepilin-type N-terminal cleavage/methylation domain-containing protein